MQNNPEIAHSAAIAVWSGLARPYFDRSNFAKSSFSIALPIAAYAFLGVEIIAVTAFEAGNPKALHFPAKWIAYVVLVLEFSVVLGEVLNVEWKDPMLPQLQGQPDILGAGHSHAVFVLAALNAEIPVLPAVLTGCIIFSILSSANTALYVASRTLFGLARKLEPTHHLRLMRWLSKLGTTTPNTKIPAWSLLVSLISFCWLPLLHAKYGYSVQQVCLRMTSGLRMRLH